MDQYYKPQRGINAFRIKNYLSDKKVKMQLGFFWKDDFSTSEYPEFEKVTFGK